MAGRDGEIVINLRRNNLNTPWGFRLQGGKEYGTYLSVQRVFNGSPSDGHLQRGDIIVAVNNEDVTQWHQNEAQNLIQSIGLTLGLVVMRGGAVPYAEARQTSQSQSVPSFARKPFGQQQQQQYASHPPPPQHQPPSPLSPQMTSKATLQFQPSPYSPSQPSNEFENIRPSPTVTWTPQAPASSSFSAPLQVRIGQPPAKPYSFSPQQGDSRAYQPQSGVGQANYQQDYVGGGGGGYAPYGREAHPQREAAQSTQQPSYGGGGDSNHVTHDRNQSHEGFGHDDRNEQAFYEGRREGGGGGGGGEGGAGEEDEDYQQMTVRDIKQMFNKPDQKGSTAVSRVKQPQRLWTRPAAEGSLSPGAYGAPGPMPHQPSSLSPRKPMTGSIQRGPPPSDDDYRRQPLSPQAHHQSYGHQPRYDAAGAGHAGGKQQKSSLAINKQGGAYGGIIQPALPAKTPPAKSSQKGAQQKKEFDPNQSAVYKILLEEEERKKNNPNQKDEEEEEGEAPRRGPAARQGGGGGQQGPRRQTQASKPPPPAQGSRLTELLERDAAQIAPYKEKPKSAYEEHVAAPYHHEQQRPTYQEPPRPSYHQEPPQQPHRGPPGPPSHGAPVARQSQPSHYGGGGGSGGAYDYHQNAFPQTQYVDGIPTSDF